jgi:hypothetical protein
MTDHAETAQEHKKTRPMYPEFRALYLRTKDVPRPPRATRWRSLGHTLPCAALGEGKQVRALARALGPVEGRLRGDLVEEGTA